MRRYLFQLGECDARESLDERSTEHIPIILTEVQNFVLECRGLGYIESSLWTSRSKEELGKMGDGDLLAIMGPRMIRNTKR
jgi:hypothetical protein